MPTRGDRGRGPYEAEMVRRVAERAPLGFTVFLLCLALNIIFEFLHFPERRRWMAIFAAGFLLLVTVARALVRRRPASSVSVLLGFVNVVGVALNLYHLIVGASVAMGLWSLTVLFTASAVILPWGSRNQALACVGTLLSYPLQLAGGPSDPLTWGAGGAYLFLVGSLGVFAASLFARSLRTDLELVTALSERRAWLQSYFDLSLVGVAILSPEGRCGEVNDELCRMFGYARPELLRLAWLDLVPAEERGTAAALLAQALSPAGTPATRDMRCVRRDGEALDAIVSVRGLPGPEGAIDQVMVLVQNITERKRVEAERERYLAQAEMARQRAEEVSRAKDVFLATVSHELRTPLSAVVVWTHLLEGGSLDTTKASRALEAIARNVASLTRVVEDLTDVSRIASGKLRLKAGAVDVREVIAVALAAVRPGAQAKSIRLSSVLPAAPGRVWGDAGRLQQVIWNLLSNAIKFTPQGGRVEVQLGVTDSHAEIVVSDTGQGIRPDFLPFVFERFRQAEGAATRAHGGLGLGLAIVRQLVELHGGTVRAESPGDGQGATFTVSLPLPPRGLEGEEGREEPGTTDAPSLAGRRVLVVDDEPDAREWLTAVLEQCGAAVTAVASAREALGALASLRPDILVSDIAMPGEDGYSLIEKIRVLEARCGGRIPAVALTAYAGPEDRRRALAAGYELYVSKPVTPEELVAAVANLSGPSAV